MIPWHMLKLDESDSREEVLSSSRRLPMVVCASLLDRAPNIGGLTRTCEVFGLEAITIADLKVMQVKGKQEEKV
jgi:tRNA G18 (ribose-2'-O)-methylase SpoU